MTADSLLSMAVSYVVKADCVQGDATNVQREIRISVAALNGPLW